MKFRELAVLMRGFSRVLDDTQRALVAFDRVRRTPFAFPAAAVVLVGAGVAAGALAMRPELRERARAWLVARTHGGAAVPLPRTDFAATG